MPLRYFHLLLSGWWKLLHLSIMVELQPQMLAIDMNSAKLSESTQNQNLKEKVLYVLLSFMYK